LAVLVSGVLPLAKLGFLDFITGGVDIGRFGGLPVRAPRKKILLKNLQNFEYMIDGKSGENHITFII
jgi:hypothetical protein